MATNLTEKEKKEDKKAKEVEELKNNIFEEELKKIPEEFSGLLRKKEKKYKSLVEKIEKLTKDKFIGIYLTPEIDTRNDKSFPNFEKITLNFVLDDFERPVLEFRPEILFGKYFDEFLIKEERDNEEIFRLKSDKNIKFNGITITQIRENCFDSNYEYLKTIGNSITYKDSRNLIMALKTIEIHKNMVLNKFEKYVVVSAGVGSWVRGEKSNDFDVFYVIDDTDVKHMPRYQVKERLTGIIYEMAFQVAELTGVKLHIQTYLLTDFWESLKDAHPVIFTFLRDGVPFYDRGLFSAWKELLKLGKIRPSPEAIDMHMNIGYQVINNAKSKLRDILMTDIFYAVLNPSQAILMLKGYNPTTPKETVKLFKEILLEKEKIITQKEYEHLENVRSFFKELEHNEDKEISGKEIDTLLKNTEKYLKKMKDIFEDISEERTKESIVSLYNEVINEINELGIKENLIKNFNEFILENKLPTFLSRNLEDIIKAKEEYKKGEITLTEVNKILKEGRILLSELKKIEENKILEKEKNKKLIFRTLNNETGELFKVNNELYLIFKNEYYKLNNGKFDKIEELPEYERFDELILSKKLYETLISFLKIDSIVLK